MLLDRVSAAFRDIGTLVLRTADKIREMPVSTWKAN